MLPDGMNSPASKPVRCASSCCSALTLGSSPYTSSPTSAVAIASRMAGVGRVTVSERRSAISGEGVMAHTIAGGPRRAAEPETSKFD